VFLYLWNSSELPGPVYERLRIGQPRAEVAPLLPDNQRDARPVRGEPPLPPGPGAACEYYGTGRSFMNNDYAAYRLWFADGKLVSKDRFAEEVS
jgi:hypothetical protein